MAAGKPARVQSPLINPYKKYRNQNTEGQRQQQLIFPFADREEKVEKGKEREEVGEKAVWKLKTNDLCGCQGHLNCNASIYE